MKKGELRIGNLFEWTDSKNNVWEERVRSLEYVSNSGSFFVNEVNIEHCRPIALTEARLLALGFKKEKMDEHFWFSKTINGWRFITNDTVFNKKTDKWFLGFKDKNNDGDYCFDKKISKVHLVQNLVFALTQKEI